MARRAGLFVAALLVLGACASSTQLPRTLWSANHEAGTYAEWDLGGFGGHFDDGTAASAIDTTHAHSGSYSLRMTSDTTLGGAGTRNFRWAIDATGTPLPKTATYTAWFYWDKDYAPTLFWNIMQWKTRTNDHGGNDPDWAINLYNNGNGMGLEWFDVHLRSNHDGRTAPGSIKPNAWYEVKVVYTFDQTQGSVKSYLNGVQWFSISRVATQWPTTSTNPRYRQWSVNNYTDANTPAISNLWVDDVSIDP